MAASMQAALYEVQGFTHVLEKLPTAVGGRWKQAVNYTCLDASDCYLTVGSEQGYVFVVHMTTGRLVCKLNDQGREQVTQVKMNEKYGYAAYGTKEGTLRVEPTFKPQAKKYIVQEQEKQAVSSLAWSGDGLTLYCGYVSGKLVQFQFNFKTEVMQAVRLPDCGSDVIQLSVYKDLLLISTLARAFLLNTTTLQITQVGRKDRKSGNFGGTFATDSTVLFTARPGMRICTGDCSGQILHTSIFRDTLAMQTAVKLPSNQVPPPTFTGTWQFSLLFPWVDTIVVTYHERILWVLDPEQVAVIGFLAFDRNISSVCTSGGFLYVLCNGGNPLVTRLALTKDFMGARYKAFTLVTQGENQPDTGDQGHNSNNQSSLALDADPQMTSVVHRSQSEAVPNSENPLGETKVPGMTRNEIAMIDQGHSENQGPSITIREPVVSQHMDQEPVTPYSGSGVLTSASGGEAGCHEEAKPLEHSISPQVEPTILTPAKHDTLSLFKGSNGVAGPSEPVTSSQEDLFREESGITDNSRAIIKGMFKPVLASFLHIPNKLSTGDREQTSSPGFLDILKPNKITELLRKDTEVSGLPEVQVPPISNPPLKAAEIERRTKMSLAEEDESLHVRVEHKKKPRKMRKVQKTGVSGTSLSAVGQAALETVIDPTTAKFQGLLALKNIESMSLQQNCVASLQEVLTKNESMGTQPGTVLTQKVEGEVANDLGTQPVMQKVDPGVSNSDDNGSGHSSELTLNLQPAHARQDEKTSDGNFTPELLPPFSLSVSDGQELISNNQLHVKVSQHHLILDSQIEVDIRCNSDPNLLKDCAEDQSVQEHLPRILPSPCKVMGGTLEDALVAKVMGGTLEDALVATSPLPKNVPLPDQHQRTSMSGEPENDCFSVVPGEVQPFMTMSDVSQVLQIPGAIPRRCYDSLAEDNPLYQGSETPASDGTHSHEQSAEFKTQLAGSPLSVQSLSTVDTSTQHNQSEAAVNSSPQEESDIFDPLRYDYDASTEHSMSTRMEEQNMTRLHGIAGQSPQPLTLRKDPSSAIVASSSQGSVGNSKMMDIWFQLPNPSKHHINCLCVSDRLIWTIDSKGSTFYSDLSSKETKWHAIDSKPVSYISASPSGNVVWCIQKGVAKARSGLSQTNLWGQNWKTTTKSSTVVRLIAVDEDSVWVLKSDGKVLQRLGVSALTPEGNRWVDITGSEIIVFSYIACSNKVVWALDNTGRPYIRTGISATNLGGKGWMVVKSPPLNIIAITSMGIIWVIDKEGKLGFRCGATMEKPAGDNGWWEVVISNHSPLLQRYQTFRRTEGVASLITFSEQNSISAVQAASKAGVWVLDSNNKLHACWRSVTGYRYKKASKDGMFEVTLWTKASAGLDAKWLVRYDGILYCLLPKRGLISIEMTGPVQLIATSPMATWVVAGNHIWSRQGMTPESPEGISWDYIEISPMLQERKIRYIACSNYAAWVVDDTGVPHFRFGVHAREKGTGMSPAWIPVEHNPKPFRCLAVSPDSLLVWACDEEGGVYARTRVTRDFPVGIKWEPVLPEPIEMLCASDTKLFALSKKGELLSRIGILESPPTGNYWRKMPGKNYKFISTTASGEVWVIDADGVVYVQRTMSTLVGSDLIVPSDSKPCKDEECIADDNWEML